MSNGDALALVFNSKTDKYNINRARALMDASACAPATWPSRCAGIGAVALAACKKSGREKKEAHRAALASVRPQPTLAAA